MMDEKTEEHAESEPPQKETESESTTERKAEADQRYQNSNNEEKGTTDPQDVSKEEDEDSKYPSTKVVIVTALSLYLAVFLSSLDRTIIGVIIPAISNHYKSFGDIAWYEAAYLLTFSTLQLPTGRLYTLFPAKWVFLALVAIFEVGSILCAAAPTSTAFIIGRAIAGIGSSGILSGATVIFANLLPLRKRPKFQGGLGAAFGLASIIGPLVGGVFATKVTWRWGFWINLPVGGVALVSILFFLPNNPPPERLTGTWRQKFLKFDPLGTMLLIPGLICLLFALQFGGNKYPWNDARVIALFVLGPILLVAFVAVEIWVVGDNGTIPRRIINRRSIAAATSSNFGLGGALVITTFYLPIYYQAIKGISATDAGARLLAYFLGSVVFVIGSGFVVSKTGYYTPWLIGGSAILVVGSGLVTTFGVNTSTGQSIGYQLIIGAGVGSTLQQGINAAQTVLPEKDIPLGVTLLTFTQLFSGSIGIPVCQAVLANTLSSQLSSKIPGIKTSAVSSSGATDIRNLVPADKVPLALEAYSKAIDNVFYVSLALAGWALISSLFVEWKSVKKAKSG